ncbi:hypothetical protein BHU72_01425 [Desulfuribacillus stibiiarsenatis]|uniref:DNA-binding response regulator n=1 Tax=Desulfuribacillus stibiiarsenatis TaxID=1390249 RepID=A0A1E5L9Y4_9FIRM|nr:LytTR family DNA-binding domain-containing protein [Desulfuribacillus stibiiarsenatis]OEH86946.1 hypothetical protein BHU72_01425 [Desulfuribacillus stibiiarsenatis]
MDYEVQVIIAEDHPAILEHLACLVENFESFKVVATAMNGEDFVQHVRRFCPDVVFVDIDLPLINGLEAVKQIQQEGFTPLVVFFTAHLDHALDAYQLSAVDYITKPIDEDRVYRTLNRLSDQMKKDRSYISSIQEVFLDPGRIYIKDGHGVVFIKQQDIQFVTKKDKKCVIITKDKTFETNESMGEIELKLNKRMFIRSHKSFIINLTKVQQISPWGKGAYVINFEGTTEEAYITRDKVHMIYKILNIPYKEEH